MSQKNLARWIDQKRERKKNQGPKKKNNYYNYYNNYNNHRSVSTQE